MELVRVLEVVVLRVMVVLKVVLRIEGGVGIVVSTDGSDRDRQIVVAGNAFLCEQG